MSGEADWRREATGPVPGWDWSRLEGRRVTEPFPWDYATEARAAMTRARRLLDVGTGGGERLASLADAFPPHVAATVSHAPNLDVARARLAPFGVEVVPARRALPFADDAFDLVLNRMAGYDAAEVARVLAPGGVFLTERLDPASHQGLRRAFGRVERLPSDSGDRVAALRAAGLEVDRAERAEVEVVYRDVGALVAHLSGMPWVVPGFSVERDADTLRRLDERLAHGGRLSFPRVGWLIVAREPG